MPHAYRSRTSRARVSDDETDDRVARGLGAHTDARGDHARRVLTASLRVMFVLARVAGVGRLFRVSTSASSARHRHVRRFGKQRPPRTRRGRSRAASPRSYPRPRLERPATSSLSALKPPTTSDAHTFADVDSRLGPSPATVPARPRRRTRASASTRARRGRRRRPVLVPRRGG